MLAFCLLAVGILSRLVVHVDNFTPVIALALFGGVYLKKSQAVLVPFVLFAVTDIILGFHNTMFFTWGSVALIVLIGLAVRKNKNWATVLSGGLASAVLFFIISNFGVWMMTGMYPLTLAGLSECYVAAIPYFRSSLVSTLLYGLVFFGGYEVVAAQVRNTRLSHVL
jgi:hypothetical protein